MTPLINQGSDLADLVKTIKNLAGRDVGEAVSLPPSAYTSTQLYELEKHLLFENGWICLARADELPNPGDFLTSDICGTQLVSVRQDSGAILTFENRCLHRGAQLVSGHGNCRRISCPYHGWFYDVSGQLIGAPQMQKTKGFKPREHRLASVRTELWQGWLYVTLNPNIASVENQLGGLLERLAPFQLSRQVHIVRRDEIWRANWKVVTENFMESYHNAASHPETVEPTYPVKLIETTAGSAYYNLHFFHASPQKEHASWPPIQNAADTGSGYAEQESRHYDVCFYPSHGFTGGRNFVFWISVLPLAVDQAHVRWGFSAAPEYLETVPDRQTYTSEIESFLNRLNLEDRTVLEGVQRTQRSRLAKPGPLASIENTVWEFEKYLARSLEPVAENIEATGR